MKKLTFKLKQHTPLIHFQHDQHGATLRATELKPKLDKFLIGKLKLSERINEKEVPKEEYKSWFNDAEKLSLNYKVRITKIKDKKNKGKDECSYFESRIKEEDKVRVKNKLINELNLPNLEIVAPSAFFANNDKRANHKYDEIGIGILWTGFIKIEIITFVEKLRTELENLFPLFLCVENFGTRQSKGFGSFTDINTTNENFAKTLVGNYSFSKSIKQNSNNVFKDIDTKYKNLKNNAGSDVSKIRDYFANKDIEWEKRFITKSIIKNEYYTSDKEIMYVRALLGLAELHDYQQFNKKVKIKHIKNGDKEINRFQSPLMFKVFDKNIYVVVIEKYITEILGEWFNFYVGDFPKKEDEDAIKALPKLQVPTSFDIVDFIKNNI